LKFNELFKNIPSQRQLSAAARDLGLMTLLHGELHWPLKWIVKMAAAAILYFFASEILCQRKLRLTRVYPHTKFGEDILKGGPVMAI